MRHIYPNNVYELPETLFVKLQELNLQFLKKNKYFLNNLAVFDSESICVPTELIETQTTSWLGTHVPTSFSMLSNSVDEPIFLYYKDPQNLITDFVSNLELLAEKVREMRTKFQDIEVAVKERMKKIFDQLTKRGRNYSSK